MSSNLRRRKQNKKEQQQNEGIICPPVPTAVKTAGFKFWSICTVRNLIIFLIIFGYIAYNQMKISEKSSIPSSSIQENRIIPPNVLPLTPILNSFYHRNIVTSNNHKIVSEYFDQSMVLSAAFNHDEAIRSLEYALLNDKFCVMCHWAIAYNYGSNLNRETDDERLPLAIKHANLAKKYSNKIEQDQITQDLVDAMILRFPLDRTINDDDWKYLKIFSDEMEHLSIKYPNDEHILTLFVESLMNTMPWNYYKIDENNKYIPKNDTLKIFNLFSKIFEINQNNLLTLHLYIHVHELDLSQILHDKNVITVADRLRDLFIGHDIISLYGIGHLLHMPSHIYIRIGRFEDSNIVNINAINVAHEYCSYYNISAMNPNYNHFYRVFYYCHRITFVMYSSLMSGQLNKSIFYTKYFYKKCRFSAEYLSFFFENASWMNKILIRFGKFDYVINNKSDIIINEYLPNSKSDNQYALVQNEFSIAFSYISSGFCEIGFKYFQNKFLPKYKDFTVKKYLLKIAKHSFLGRYYDRCLHNLNQSIIEWNNAIKEYDDLYYTEPPSWPINIKSCLGQLYLENNLLDEAIKIFKDDLNQLILNGWSLKGIILSLQQKYKNNNNSNLIKKYQKQFDEAWKYSDINIESACY